MFKNERYLSRGVNYTIPLELQLFLWECVERILKYMSAIALIVAAGKAGVELGALPFDDDKEG